MFDEMNGSNALSAAPSGRAPAGGEVFDLVAAIRRAVRDEMAPLRRQLEEIRDEKKPPELAVTVKEAARRMSVSPRTIQRMVKSGELLSTLVGRSRRIFVASLKQREGRA